MPHAIVYVDGFNLFYRLLRGTPFRWLNLSSLFTAMLPAHTVQSIYYFTAHVKSDPTDRDKPIRQGLYLRALGTLPEVSIIKGYYLRTKVWARPVAGPPNVQVWKSEEKGSDVNIATQMLLDAHAGITDVIVVVSNDTDLVNPMLAVRDQLGKHVLLLSPVTNPNAKLVAASSSTQTLLPIHVAAHQFPTLLTDAKGTFHKPSTW